MRSGFQSPVGSSEVPLQFPRDPCVCGRDRARERLRREQSPVSGYRPARPPPRAAECTAGPGDAVAPLRAGAQAGPGAAGSPERRAAEELGSGAKVSSQLWPRALPLPPPTPARGLGPTPPPPGPGPGPGRQFRFWRAGSSRQGRARAGAGAGKPKAGAGGAARPSASPAPGHLGRSLPAAACSQIDLPAGGRPAPGGVGVAASP